MLTHLTLGLVNEKKIMSVTIRTCCNECKIKKKGEK